MLNGKIMRATAGATAPVNTRNRFSRDDASTRAKRPKVGSEFEILGETGHPEEAGKVTTKARNPRIGGVKLGEFFWSEDRRRLLVVITPLSVDPDLIETTGDTKAAMSQFLQGKLKRGTVRGMGKNKSIPMRVWRVDLDSIKRREALRAEGPGLDRLPSADGQQVEVDGSGVEREGRQPEETRLLAAMAFPERIGAVQVGEVRALKNRLCLAWSREGLNLAHGVIATSEKPHQSPVDIQFVIVHDQAGDAGELFRALDAVCRDWAAR